MADLFGMPVDEPTVETKWCPADWLDEVAGTLVIDPADCVHPDGRGGWELLDDDAKDDRFEGNRIAVELGQIVTFCAHRDYGHFEIFIHDDGEFDIDPYPADASYFAHADAGEDVFDEVKELVANGDPAGFGSPLGPGTHTISIWHWSDDIPFRFEVEDGKPKFVRCAGAQ